MAELHNRFEVLRTDEVLLLVFLLELFVQLPDLDELVLPASVSLFCRAFVFDLNLFSLLRRFFLLLLLKSLDQLLFVAVLVFDLLFNLAKFVHQTGDFAHAVVVEKHTRKGATSILVLAFFHLTEALPPACLLPNQLA